MSKRIENLPQTLVIDWQAIQGLISREVEDQILSAASAKKDSDLALKKHAEHEIARLNRIAYYACALAGNKLTIVNGKFLLPSSRMASANIYRVDEQSCTCQAGLYGGMCIHQDLVGMILETTTP